MEEKYFSIKIPAGATLSGLAKKYGTSVQKLAEINKIPDPNKIYAGQELKIPKIDPEKAPDIYHKRFKYELEKLYRGDYGFEKARKILGTKLEKAFPQIDVWKDVYSKIPDNWEKIAFPEKTIKKPEDLPEPKKSLWSKVNSFVENKIIDPLKEKAKETAFSLVRRGLDIPSPEEVYKKTKQKLTQDYFPKIVKTVKGPIEDALKYSSMTKARFIDLIKYEPEKSLVEEAKEILDKSIEKIAKKLAPKEQIEMAEILKGQEDLIKKGEEGVKKGLPIEEIVKQKTETGFKLDPFISAGVVCQLQTDLLEKKDDLAKHGIYIEKTPEGNVAFKRELEGLKGKELEEKIKKDREQAIEKVVKDYTEKWGDFDHDPYISLLTKRTADLTKNTFVVLDSIIKNLGQLKQSIVHPETFGDKDVKELSFKLKEIIEKNSALESIDPTIESLDSQLEKFGRSTKKLEDYYSQKIGTDEKPGEWWQELESILGKEATKALKKEKKTKADEEIFLKRLSELKPAERSKVFDLLEYISQGLSYFGIKYDLLQYLDQNFLNPQVFNSIRKFSKSFPEVFKSPEIQAILEAQEQSQWLKQKAEELKKGFVTHLAENFNNPKALKQIRSQIKKNKAISSEQAEAALKLIDFLLEDVEISQWVNKKFSDLGKAAKIMRETSFENEKLLWEKRAKQIGRYVEQSRLKQTFFFLNDATWEDFKEMIRWEGLNYFKTRWLPLPTPDVMKRVEVAGHDFQIPSGWKFRVSPIEAVKGWWKPVEYGYDVSRRHLVAGFNAGVMTMIKALEESSQEDLFAGIPVLEKVGEFEKKIQRKELEILKIFIAADPKTFLPKGVSYKDGIAGNLKYLYDAYNKFKSPAAYETFKVTEDTKLEIQDGKLKLGPYVFENLTSRSQFYAFNPNLAGKIKIPKGTEVTIPRYQPMPRFTDLLSDQDRYEFYKNHGFLAVVLDEFVPYTLPIERIVQSAVPARLIAGKLVSAFHYVPAKGLQKMKSIDKFRKTAEVLENTTTVSYELLKLLTPSPINWNKMPSVLRNYRLPITKVRAKVFQLTFLKRLADIEAQASINALNEQIARELTESYLVEEIDNLFNKFIAFFEKAAKTNPKYARFNKEQFKADLRLVLLDYTTPPDERVARFLSKYGLTYYDLIEFAEARPYLKEPVKELWEKAMSKQGIIEANLWEKAYAELPQSGKEILDQVKQVIIAGIENPKAAVIKDRKSLIAYINKAKKLRLRKNPEKLQEVEKGIEQAKTMALKFWDFLESRRKALERAKVAIPLPNGLKLVRSQDSKILEGERSILKTVGKDKTYYFNPKRFPQREYEVMGDVIGNNLVGRRIDAMWDEAWANVGVQLLKKETKTFEDSLFALKKKIGNFPKGREDILENWIKKLGKEKVKKLLESGDLYLAEKKIKTKKEFELYLAKKKKAKKEIEVPMTYHADALKGKDFLFSDYFQNFKTRKLEGINEIHKTLLNIFPSSPEEKVTMVARSTYRYDSDIISLVQKDEPLRSWQKVEIKTTKQKRPLHPEALKLFYQRSAFLDFLKQSHAGREFLMKYKYYLVPLVQDLHFKAQKSGNVNKFLKKFLETKKPVWYLDYLLLQFFGTKEILSDFARILLLEDRWLAFQKDVIKQNLKKFAHVAYSNRAKSLLSAWRKVGKRDFELMQPWGFDVLDKNIEDAILSLGHVREAIPMSYRLTEINTIVPKLKPYWPKAKVTEEEFQARLKTFYERKIIQIKNYAKKFCTAPENKRLEIFKQLQKVKLPLPSGDLQKEIQKLPVKGKPREFLKFLRESSIWDWINPMGEKDRLFRDEDLLKLLSIFPRNWRKDKESRKNFELAVLHFLKNTETGRILQKAYVKQIEKLEKAHLKAKKPLPSETFVNLWEKLGYKPEIFAGADPLAKKDFWDLMLSRFELIFKFLQTEGFMIKFGPAVKGERIIKEFKRIRKVKKAKKALSKPEDLKQLTQDFLDRLSSLLNLKNYAGPEGLKKLITEIRSIRQIKEKIAKIQKELAGLYQSIKNKQKLLKDYERLSSKNKTLRKLIPNEKKELEKLLKEGQKLQQDLENFERSLAAYDARISGILETWSSKTTRVSESSLDRFDLILNKKISPAELVDRLETEITNVKFRIKRLEENIKKARGAHRLELLKNREYLKNQLDDLNTFKELFISLKRLQDANVVINLDELHLLSKGLLPGSVKKWKKIDAVLSAPLILKKSPIPLDQVSQKLFSTIPEIQQRLKKIKIKVDFDSVFKDYFPKNFGTSEYVVPQIKSLEISKNPIEQLENLSKKGVKAIVDLTGDLKKFSSDIPVFSIEELKVSNLPWLASSKSIPSETEVDGFLKLRKIFKSHKHLAIVDHDINRAKEITQKLRKVYLSPIEQKLAKAAADLYFEMDELAKKRPKGFPPRYPRSHKEYISVMGEPKLAFDNAKYLDWPEAIKYLISKGDLDVASMNMRTALWKDKIIPKELYKLDDYSKRVPVLLIAPETKSIPENELRRLITAYKKQGAEFYLPGKDLRDIEVIKKIPLTKNIIKQQKNLKRTAGLSQMRFDVPVVKNTLVKYGAVYTVRGFQMTDKPVWVKDIGVCFRKRLTEIRSQRDLLPYLHLSGFDSTSKWWEQIQKFAKGKRIWLYEVSQKAAIPKLQKFVIKRATDLTSGERIIEEFLKANKIPFKYLDAPFDSELFTNPAKNWSLSKKYPAFLYPIGTKFTSEQEKILNVAKRSHRLFKPIDDLHAEIVKTVQKEINDWIKEIKTRPPLYIQEQLRSGLFKSPLKAIAYWRLQHKRGKAKETFRKVLEQELKSYRNRLKTNLLKETGNLELTSQQKAFIDDQVSRFEDGIKMMEFIYDWDKKPNWLEKIEDKIAKKLELVYKPNYDVYFLKGFPVADVSKSRFQIAFLKSLASVIHKTKDAYKVLKTIVGVFRSVWVWNILYGRPGWHIKNQYSDVIRNTLASRSIKSALAAHLIFVQATADFSKKFGKNLVNLAKFTLSEKELKEAEAILDPKVFRRWKNTIQEAKSSSYKLWDPEAIWKAKNKGLLSSLDKQSWKISNLDSFLNWKVASQNQKILTPAGEVLTREMIDYICASGLYQASSDPVFLRRLLPLMDESAWWKRLRKRFFVLKSDIELYASFAENMRRQVLMFDLLFNKAMTLAEARAKVWKFLYNYRDLSIVGRIFRYFFPFWAFNSNTVKLYSELTLKLGPRYWIAGRALLQAWNQANMELPEWARGRIKIGKDIWWYPWWEGFNFFYFLIDPVKSLKEFGENLHRVPLGLGWDPYFTTLIEEMTGKKYWDATRDLYRQYGWTETEIDKYLKDLNLKKDTSDDFMDHVLTFFPLVKTVWVLHQVDMYNLIDGASILHSRKLREFLKTFGLNILKWDDLRKFQEIYFSARPVARREIAEELKAKDPAVWDALQRYWAKLSYLKAAETAKKDPVKATAELQAQAWKQIYFDLENEKKGKGQLWLEKHPEAKEELEKYFRTTQTTPYSMWNERKVNLAKLASEVRALADKIYRKEVLGRARILGINISFAICGNKQEFLDMFFDKAGNLKIATMEEFEKIFGHEFADKTVNNTKQTWQELIAKNADVRYHQWLKEKTEAKTSEDKIFAQKMANWQAILPENIGEMPEKEAMKYWSAYWNYFEKYFSEAEKTKYFSMLKERKGQWFYEYRLKMREYCNIWNKLFEKGEREGDNFQYFEEFYSQPEWFRKVYFFNNPNKEKWYPFARKWMKMLFELEKKEKETGMTFSEERKKISEYFWSHEDLVKLWDKDNPGFYNYMKLWKDLFELTEDHPEKYYGLFYSQPKWFQDRFFERNPEAKIYYPFIYKWQQLIKKDQENRKIGKETNLGYEWFWSSKNKRARELWGAKKIDKTHTRLDYQKIWKEFFGKDETNIEDYFEFFYTRPQWFIDYFFKTHPEERIYYPKVKEWSRLRKEDENYLKKTGKRSFKAAEYFEKEIKGNPEVVKAWTAKDPKIIEYLDIWNSIIKKASESSPEVYFKLFFSQPQWFRDRFFKAHPDRKLYYPKLYVWVQKIAMDKRNQEKGKKTNLAWEYFKTWKDGPAGKAYAKNNMITETKSEIDYLELWHKVIEHTEEDPHRYFKFFYEQSEWFITHYFNKNPLKKKYYWLGKEISEAPPEKFGLIFWRKGTRYEEARKAWQEDNPDFMDYMRFWKKLSVFASTKQWDLYFKFYFAPENEKWRLRHWKNHPEAKERYTLAYEYQRMPSLTWEEKRAKRQFIKEHPQLLEWWSEDLSEEDAKIREKLNNYYDYIDKIPADGKGKDYFLKVRKWEVKAEHYLLENQDLALWLQRHAKKETGEDASIYSLAQSYFDIELPSERKEFLEDHPELKDYFKKIKPPGIRKILDLQEKFFALSEEFRDDFLKVHPELQDYWEVSKLPYSYFFEPEKFAKWKNTAEEVEKVYELFKKGEWVQAEKKRKELPSLYSSPGESDEAAWFKFKVYSDAMQTWTKIIEKNQFIAVFFFRQLPEWIRDLYYSRHPEKKYLEKHSLERFLEEPLRVESALNSDLAWAQAMLYKYGKNMPSKLYEKVRDIMIKEGIWEDRSQWTKEDWRNYWAERARQMAEASKFDFENIPLLRTAYEQLRRNFPLKPNRPPWSSPIIGFVSPIF